MADDAPENPLQPRNPNRGKTEQALEQQARAAVKNRDDVLRELESGKKRFTEGK